MAGNYRNGLWHNDGAMGGGLIMLASAVGSARWLCGRLFTPSDMFVEGSSMAAGTEHEPWPMMDNSVPT
jgi:hypothetical protein